MRSCVMDVSKVKALVTSVWVRQWRVSYNSTIKKLKKFLVVFLICELRSSFCRKVFS